MTRQQPTYEELEQQVAELGRERERLRQVEQQWTALMKHGYDYVLLVDRRGTIRDISQTVPGHEKLDVIGKRITDIAQPEFHATIERALRTVFVDGRIAEYESAADMPMGRRWFDARVFPLPEDADMAMLVGHDITERKDAEEALRQSEQRSRQQFDALPFPAFVMEKRGDGFTMLDHNAAAVGDTGGKVGSLLGRDAATIGSPDPQLLRAFLKCFQDHTNVRTELDYVQQTTGDHRVMDFSLTYLSPDRVMVCTDDITARKQAEDALRAREARLRDLLELNTALFEQSPIGIVVFDAEGQCTLANDAVADAVGGSRQEVLQQNLHEIESWKECGLYEAALRARRDGSIVRHEISIRSSFGKEVSLDGYLMPLSTGELVVMVNDISQKKKAERAERHAMEQEKWALIGKVAGKVAHDFNNVLSAVLALSEVLRDSDLSGEQRQDVDAIYASAQRGREITKNLRVFAKNQDLHYSEIELSKLLDGIVGAIRSDLEGIQVTTVYGAGAVRLLGDQALLSNAIVNLIRNSIHALSKTERPALTIKTESSKRSISIEVQDNGCGIPAEFHDRIFEPSFMLKGGEDRIHAYARDIRGSGYGLANVKRAADQHHGAIRFTSEPGVGSTFRLELPVVDDSLTTEVQHQEPLEEGGGRRILVVEDEHVYANVLYRVLRKAGYRVSLAHTGAVALDLLAEQAFDAISLDFILPDMTGMTVYTKIREIHEKMPIIFVSGNFEFMQSMIDLKQRDQWVDHVGKPVENVEYVRTIAEWLARSQPDGE